MICEGETGWKEISQRDTREKKKQWQEDLDLGVLMRCDSCEREMRYNPWGARCQLQSFNKS